PLMAAHPPFLYLGFIGFTVPFAFAMAALVSGTLSDRWIRITRRWTLAAWIFLSTGLVLGALWSYGVLGWGGYWAWDPVENVALLPWLMTSAFLHSVMIQERRGMLKIWNLSMIVGAFARGGVRRQQPRAALDHVQHAPRDDLPALRRGAHLPPGDRGRALLPRGDDPVLPPPALPHGRGTAPRLAARVRRAGAPAR